MNESRRSLNRIERIVEIRQTFVAAAEAAVREAEQVVRQFEGLAEENARQTRQAREEIAYLQSCTGLEIQTREQHILSLNYRALQIAQDIEKARQVVEKRRLEWREAMKARKIVERVQERRMQEWVRALDVMEQKQVDEISVGKHARDKSRTTTRPSGPHEDGESPESRDASR